MALEMKYFVLRPRAKRGNDRHAFASRVAMHAYARSIRDADEDLAVDLNRWAERETKRAVTVELAEAVDGALDLEDDGRVDAT